MTAYIIRRLLLLPLTLLVIILVNFVILNLAPGEPSTQANIGATGEASRSADETGVTGENQYLLFREHYGLTLPILWNTWPSLTIEQIRTALDQLAHMKGKMSVQTYHALRTLWGDRARFVMPYLMQEALDPTNSFEVRKMAANLLIRGGILQGHVGAILASEQRAENRIIATNNIHLGSLRIHDTDTLETLDEKIFRLSLWFEEKGGISAFSKTKQVWIKTLLFETRFCRYLGRVLTLNFGTLRNDSNKTVISEVGKRMKYSLTLAIIPLGLTFILCQIFGMLMAVWQNQWIDYSLNIFFLLLFAIPVFVAAPFLIEKIALHHTVPLTDIPIPYSGFHSPEEIYQQYTSPQRLIDTILHLLLPLIAIKYGTLAVQARLSRTAFLEVMRQDYVRTARAKGLSPLTTLIKHVGRNGAITIMTSLAASLGVVLGGSLIVETIFEINGFGRFFYAAILNRDYNVVLFSAFAGSCLTLLGYLVADISYTFLDPRISLE
jgi:peptide/nickel transport system permease protein